MKTFQIRISKEGKHRCLKFNSELPMESVLGAVKAVVKNTYNVSIKEIHWKAPEDRDIMWAIKEAASIRFYHKVWKEVITRDFTIHEFAGQTVMPSGTKVECNVTTNTFFDFCFPAGWYIKPDISKINELLGLDIRTTNEGSVHPFYLRGKYRIECNVCTKGTLVTFYKIYTKQTVHGEFVTEEL